LSRVARPHAARVDRQHHALGPELAGRLGKQFGPRDRGGVERDFVGAGAQQRVDVLAGPHPAADRQRDEYLPGGAAHDVVHGLAAAAGRGDVQEGQLVRAFGVVPGGEFDRVAGVPQVAEVHALDDPARVHVQARDHPHRNRHMVSSVLGSSRRIESGGGSLSSRSVSS
jgi:hypothetical protein